MEKARHKPGVVIQSSAVGYYGPRGDEEITEDDSPGDDSLSRLCIDWEASTAAVEAMGVRRAIVRSGVVLSLSGGALPRMLLPFRLFAGGPVGTGRQWFSWIHPADVTAAICHLIYNENATGAFNLTAPGPVTNAGFARSVGRVMRRPAVVRVPAFVLRALFGEMSTVLLTGQRTLPSRLHEFGFTFRFPDADGALEDLLG